MCVCVYVLVYTRIYVNVFVFMYIYMCVCVCVYVYSACVYEHVQVHAPIYGCTIMYTYTHIYIYFHGHWVALMYLRKYLSPYIDVFLSYSVRIYIFVVVVEALFNVGLNLSMKFLRIFGVNE